MNRIPTYLKPDSVTQALEYARRCDDNFRFLAGGTDVIVNKFQGNDNSECFIDINGIAELRRIHLDDEEVLIGATATLEEIEHHQELRHRMPVLAEAAASIASPVIRKSATVGGNLLCENRCVFYNQSEWWREAVGYCLKCDGDICIATGGKKACFSKFVSDMAVALISLHARIEILGPDGIEEIVLEDLYSGDGVNSHTFSKTSLITAIKIPVRPGMRSVFKKLRSRESVEFSSLTTTITVDDTGRLRIVLGGVDPMPILIEGSVADNLDELLQRAVKKPRVIDNDVYTRKYRKEMIAVYVKNSFLELGL